MIPSIASILDSVLSVLEILATGIVDIIGTLLRAILNALVDPQIFRDVVGWMSDQRVMYPIAGSVVAILARYFFLQAQKNRANTTAGIAITWCEDIFLATNFVYHTKEVFFPLTALPIVMTYSIFTLWDKIPMLLKTFFVDIAKLILQMVLEVIIAAFKPIIDVIKATIDAIVDAVEWIVDGVQDILDWI